jgi:SynChlorMet cassette protein ScmD
MNETEEKKVITNPQIVLREEFDDWAILFDPDTGNTFGLNPIGVLIWKQLDGRHALDDIVRTISEAADDVPSDVTGHIQAFVQNAIRFGLVRYEDHRG